MRLRESTRRRTPSGFFALAVLAVCGVMLVGAAPTRSAAAVLVRFAVPASARQLIVVSSPSHDPRGDLASFRSFQRPSASASWQPVFPRWQAETGSGGLRDTRREGDGATPTGVYGFGPTLFGNDVNPGRLHEPYHRLVCGDWWDEDPFSPEYNRFVHVRCGSEPAFAAGSEALWTETVAYPYFAMVDYNDDPTVSGAAAPGSGIFLHSWVGGPTAGCLALPLPDLLRVLRWLNPAEHPLIEIGTDAEVGPVPSG